MLQVLFSRMSGRAAGLQGCFCQVAICQVSGDGDCQLPVLGQGYQSSDSEQERFLEAPISCQDQCPITRSTLIWQRGATAGGVHCRKTDLSRRQFGFDSMRDLMADGLSDDDWTALLRLSDSARAHPMVSMATMVVIPMGTTTALQTHHRETAAAVS